MKKSGIILGIIVIVALAIIFGITQTKKEPGEIKIGAILPLTGDNASYGIALKKGMDLAIGEINAKGAKGIDNQKLTVVFEDSQGDPQKAVSALNKLIAVDKVPMVIGDMFSAGTLAIAPIAEKKKTVLLSPTASAVELTNAGDYIFRIYPSDSYDGMYLANFTRNKLKVNSVSIIYLQVASISAVTEVFKKEFESSGGKVLSMDSYKEGDADFRSQLIKAKEVNADFVFIPGYLKEMATLLRQAKEIGVNTRFLSISTFYDPKIFELAGNAAEGVLFSVPSFDVRSEAPEIKNFVSKYKAKYGNEPDILGGYGYDAVNIAEIALQKGNISPDNIKKALYAIKNFPGVTGLTSFDSNGDVLKELKIMQVQDGKFVPFE